MISLQTKIHDKFSLEFKVAYKSGRKNQLNNYKLNTWIFVPNSLDINRESYTREDFYKDLRTNIRLITPVFLLRDIASGDAIPLRNLETAMKQMASAPSRTNISEYEYQIKMFAAIFKSSLREQLNYLISYVKPDEKAKQITVFLNELVHLLDAYRQLIDIIKVPTVSTTVFDYFNFADEFLTNLTEKELFGLIRKLKKMDEEVSRAVNPLLLSVLEQEEKHKTEKNYLRVNSDSPNKNSDLVFRLGALKKYIESDLFLNVRKKRDGVFIEQFYYSIAAGLSMIFATGIAFSIQQKYGNFTMPLFVALVVSYMLKDRIKELMRYYFAHKISSKYFDNKTRICVKENEIGVSKESFDFIHDINAPADIIRVRNRIPLVEAENRYAKEKIILFKKTVVIDRKKLDASTNFDIEGVVEIVRFNFQSFIRKTDNPEVPLFVLSEKEGVEKILATKNYYLNIILQYSHDEGETFRRYRVGFNREGINSLQEM